MHQGIQRHQIDGDVGGILTAEKDATGQIVIGGRDRKFSVRSALDQPSRSMTMNDEVIELAITQDGTHVIAADVTGSVKLYHLETGTEAGEFALPTTN